MKTGVYTITNKANNKMYVGSTTISFNKRWRDHKSMLKNNKHNNIHLQRAWNKYGENSFVFEVLEECEIEFCLSFEQYWMNMLASYKEGYNRTPTAKNSKGCKRTKKQKEANSATNNWKRANTAWRGKKHSEKTKKKMSEKKKGISTKHIFTKEVRAKLSKASKKNSLGNTYRKGTGKYGKCEQYTLNWDFVKTFNNPYEAFTFLKLPNASHIIRSSKSKGITAGYRWKVYINDKLVE